VLSGPQRTGSAQAFRVLTAAAVVAVVAVSTVVAVVAVAPVAAQRN
jgi:hypothetical protein